MNTAKDLPPWERPDYRCECGGAALNGEHPDYCVVANTLRWKDEAEGGATPAIGYFGPDGTGVANGGNPIEAEGGVHGEQPNGLAVQPKIGGATTMPPLKVGGHKHHPNVAEGGAAAPLSAAELEEMRLTHGPNRVCEGLCREARLLDMYRALTEENASLARERDQWKEVEGLRARRVDALEAEASRLRTALRKYGVHKACPSQYGDMPKCTCGLNEALSGPARPSEVSQ